MIIFFRFLFKIEYISFEWKKSDIKVHKQKEVEMKKKKVMGIMALVPLALFSATSIPVSAEVTNYQDTDTSKEETSAECEVIYKTTYDFSENIPKYPELEVSASGYDGVYDGKHHGITVDCEIDGVTILYSVDGQNYTKKKPVYKDVGTYITYYKVEKNGYTSSVGSATVRIREAEIDYNASDYSGIYDGKKHGIDIHVLTKDCRVLYSVDGVNFRDGELLYKEPGTYIVYYKILKDNYMTVTGSGTVTIIAKDDAVNNDNQNGENQSDNGNNNQNDNGQTGMGQNNNNQNSTDGNANESISKVQTGDGNRILLHAAIFIASLTGLITLRRKEKV